MSVFLNEGGLMKSAYVISVITENTLEIFQRLAVVFSRNRLLINEMNFESFNKEGNSSFNIEIYTDEKKLDRIVKQLQKIIDLIDVQVETKNHFQKTKVNKEVYLCQN
jgi:acetolactate synthase I/III small subunit